jgi:hypothetical protein
MTIEISTLHSVQRPHKTLGNIVQAYAQHQLGFGSQWSAGFGNWFGGNNTFNNNIGDTFTQLKTTVLEDLKKNASETYPTCNCIAGVQIELLTLEINQGRDTILICNASGTPIEYVTKNKPVLTAKRRSRSKTIGGRYMRKKAVKHTDRRRSSKRYTL